MASAFKMNRFSFMDSGTDQHSEIYKVFACQCGFLPVSFSFLVSFVEILKLGIFPLTN